MAINNKNNNIIKQLANDFIDEILLDYPIEAFSLEEELKDFAYNKKNVNINSINNFFKNIESKSLEINKDLFSLSKDEIFINFIEGIQDPFIRDLALYIIQDEKVRKKELNELEKEELSDDYSINLWL